MNTQVELFDTSLTLLSIPLVAYPFFCQGIIRLALGTWKSEYQKLREGLNSPGSDGKRLSVPRLEDNSNASTPTTTSPPSNIGELCDSLEDFINISFTPIECSIICPTDLVKVLFGQVLATVGESMQIQVLKDEYVAIKVDCDGQDTGSSVLKISFPLSSAGIPIFFIATYFSDYVLVPVRERHRVIKTLEMQNFIFSDISNSYISIGDEGYDRNGHDNENENDENGHDNGISSTSTTTTTTTTTTSKLNTLSLFKKHNVKPLTNNSTKLLLTGARPGVLSSGNREENDVYLSIVRILLSPPEFFSLTVISGSEISFLIDSETAYLFPSHMLLGSPTDFVQPVSFDLSNLPEDSTGIVSGLASIFSDTNEIVHMRYLSTALTSVILVTDDDFDSALKLFI